MNGGEEVRRETHHMPNINSNHNPTIILRPTRQPDTLPSPSPRHIAMVCTQVNVSTIANESMVPCRVLAHVVDIAVRRVVVGPEGEFVEEFGVRVGRVVFLESVGCGGEER